MKFFVVEPFFEDDSKRWFGSFLLVVLLHGAAVFAALNWPQPSLPKPSPPLAAMAVDLAPLPTSLDKPSVMTQKSMFEEQEKPEKVIKKKPVKKPKRIKPKKPPIDTPKVAKAEAVLPDDAKPVTPQESKELEEDKTDIANPPSQPIPSKAAVEAPIKKSNVAPRQGRASLVPSNVKANWQSQLLNHLESYKRYPQKSRRRRQEATVLVRVKIDRRGQVIQHALEKASPYSALNRESLALILRAQPLPPPPDDIKGEEIEFVVPVAFSLRR